MSKSLFGSFASPEAKNKVNGGGNNSKEGSSDNGEEKKRSVKINRTKNVYHARRIASELALEQELPWHWENGCAYHCFTFGDVDSLTFLRCAVKQTPLDYCIISTWCMALTDIKEVEDWLIKGYINRCDFYVGEIFQGSYAEVYLCLREMVRAHGGRVCVFKNHSKVMVGFGRNFDFVIESSANVNTNPRSEQSTITLDTGLARFYKEEIFDGINNFTHDFDGWQPYVLKRDRK